MYGERMALKARLEELKDAEEKIMRHFQEERERIYERLRKLDEEERYFSRLFPSTENSNPIADTQQETMKEPNHLLMSENQLQQITSHVKEILKNDTQTAIEKLTIQVEEMKEAFKSITTTPVSHNTPIEGESKEERTSSVGTRRRNTKEQPKETANSKGHTLTSSKIDYEPLYQEALAILQNHEQPLALAELKKELEGKHQVAIPNMTNFMIRLMKKNPLVQKQDRGLYVYRKETQPELQVETSALAIEEQEKEKHQLVEA